MTCTRVSPHTRTHQMAVGWQYHTHTHTHTHTPHSVRGMDGRVYAIPRVSKERSTSRTQSGLWHNTYMQRHRSLAQSLDAVRTSPPPPPPSRPPPRLGSCTSSHVDHWMQRATESQPPLRFAALAQSIGPLLPPAGVANSPSSNASGWFMSRNPVRIAKKNTPVLSGPARERQRRRK